MSRGNRHVHRALHRNVLAFQAHSDTCEWPKGCEAKARWYHTTVSGRWSVCDKHCPEEYRTDRIPPTLAELLDRVVSDWEGERDIHAPDSVSWRGWEAHYCAPIRELAASLRSQGATSVSPALVKDSQKDSEK